MWSLEGSFSIKDHFFLFFYKEDPAETAVPPFNYTQGKKSYFSNSFNIFKTPLLL